MKEQVMHTGKVVSMTPQTTTVQIVSQSACSECHAAGLCGLSEYTEKAIEVPTRPSATYGVGDEVQVVLKASMGFKAVWIAYFLPLVVLLAVALGLIALGVPELVSGLAGLGAVALYYLVVWLLRDRLRNEYVFTIQA
jgi:sigma-E factor negative regulatory protein RseC